MTAKGEVIEPGVDGSLTFLDGHARLAANILLVAVRELRSPDLLTALDSLLWCMTCGPLYAGALDLARDESCMLRYSIIGGKLYENDRRLSNRLSISRTPAKLNRTNV